MKLLIGLLPPQIESSHAEVGLLFINFTSTCLLALILLHLFFTTRKRSVEQGNVFTGVCGQGRGLCPSKHHRSHDQQVSVQGGLCPEGLCPGGLCLRGVSVHWGSLSRGVFVQGGGLCPGRGVSVQRGGLYPGRGSLSREGVSIQGGGLYPGRGSLSRGSLFRGSLSREVSVQWVSVHWGVSVQGVSVRDQYSNELAVRILLECVLVCLVRSV